jgi:hypothetical protein
VTKADIVALETKADKTDLEAKADKSEMTALNATLTGKANQTEFTELTTNVTDTRVKLRNFQAKTALDLATKANEVDLASKANVTDLALKANLTDLVSRASLSNLATKVSKSGDTMNGNLFINLNNDTTRLFGVNDIGAGKTAVLLLGNAANSILCSHNSPLLITGDKGTKFNCAHGDVCLFGRDDDGKADFFKDILMNGKTITNLKEPILGPDVATKLYVDTKCAALSGIDARFTSLATRANTYTNTKIAAAISGITPLIPYYVKNNVGLVPYLTAAINKNGYEISASSRSLFAYLVFSMVNAREWESAGVNRDFWIQIKLPQPVIIYQISLRGKNSNTDQISSFILKGSNDDNIWVDLVTMQRMIGTAMEFLQFPEVLHVPYMYYRLHILEAEGLNPGLSHWQLYSLDPLI